MTKVEFFVGESIEKAHERLLIEAIDTGEITYGEFNGKTLYSTDSIDDCYKKVVGMTKA